MTVYRPDVRCPKCGKRPPLDITEAERTAAKGQPPGLIRMHYVCRCSYRLPIAAAAFADAHAVAVTKFVGKH